MNLYTFAQVRLCKMTFFSLVHRPLPRDTIRIINDLITITKIIALEDSDK